MAVAVNIRADSVSARGIEDVWDQVSAFEDEPSLRALAYRPHFTFAIYDSPEIDAAAAWSAMQRASSGETHLRIGFSRIRWFDGPPLVLWTEPETDEALVRMHRSIHEVIDPAYCHPHYRPGAWVPHCTLAMRIGDARRSDALSFARAFRGRLEVVFDVVDCVAYPPVRIAFERLLAPAPA